MPHPAGIVPLDPGGRRNPAPEPLRRRKPAPVSAPSVRRKLLSGLVIFVGVVLVVDALVGEKGLVEMLRARDAARLEAAKVNALRQENARLREVKRRLSDDPSAIEAEARQQLGFTRPGEVMFILKDIRPSERTGPRPPR